MKSDEVDPVCGLYTKLRIRSEKYRPDAAKVDLRLKQLTLFLYILVREALCL